MFKKGEGYLFGNVTLILFIVFFLYWIGIQIFQPATTSFILQLFSGTYCLIALSGGISGLIISRKWGGFKSIMGKAISFFSISLLAQFFGQVSYSLLMIFTHEIPYPSFGDIGYFGSIFLYFIGLYYLAKASGALHIFKTSKYKYLYLLIPFILLFCSYKLFLKDYTFDFSNLIKIVLDLGYPLGQASYVSLAIIIYLSSKGILGGLMKPKIILLLFALLMQFLADFSYILASNYFKVQPAGWNDLIFLLAYYFMSIALIEMLTVYHEIKKL
jgi:hypothetical protein